MNIYLKIISLFLLLGCATTKDKNILIDVIYEAQTRGRSELVTFSDKQLLINTSTEKKTIDLSDNQVKYINTLISKLTLDKISDLEAPSNKRAYDGALNAIIKIKAEKETYTSSVFDHDNPPKALKKIVKILRTYIK